MSKGRRFMVTSDAHTDRILARVRHGDKSEYVREAIAEKALRDEHRGELDELRARLARIEAELQRLKRGASKDAE